MQQILNGGVARTRTTPRSTLASDPLIWSAVLVALVVRLVRLETAPLWLDETMTAQLVNLGWGESIRGAVQDNYLPLYFLIVKAWSQLAGYSPWALRLPSVLASSLAVPLIAAIAATLSGRRAARWAAWLAAGAPFLIHHGQEARMYALVVALAAAHLLLLARFVTGTSRRLGWGFVMTAAALLASHYYTMFFVSGEILALCVLRPQPLRAWVPATLAAVAAIAAALLAAAILSDHHAGGEYDLGWLALPGIVWSMLSGYALLPSSEELHRSGWHAALSYMPFAAIAAVPLAAVALGGLRALGYRARLLLVATLAIAALGPFAAHYLLPVALNPRYFASGLPSLLVLLAAGAPPSWGANARSMAMLVLVAVIATGSIAQLRDPGYGREDIRAAAAWLDANVPPDEELLMSSGEMAMLARFHWPTRQIEVYPEPGVVVTGENVDAVADRLPFPGPQRAVYVFGRTWLSDPTGTLQRTLSERYGSCGEARVRGIHILCLVRPEMVDQRQAAAQPMRGPAMAPQANGRAGR